MAPSEMTVAAFLRQVRLAARVLRGGGLPPKLEPTAAVLLALGIPEHAHERVRNACIEDQVAILGPVLARHLDAEVRARGASAAVMARRLAEAIARASVVQDGRVVLPFEPVQTLASVPAFDALCFAIGERALWCYPRGPLGKVMASLRNTRESIVTLREGRLELCYRTQGGGGRFTLLDRPLRGREGVLTIALPSPAAARVEPPASCPAPRPAPARPRHQPPPPATSVPAWAVDAAHALVDGLFGW